MTVGKPAKNSLQETAANVRVIESDEIFGRQNEIIIRHDGALYRLRITKQNKLILNK